MTRTTPGVASAVQADAQSPNSGPRWLSWPHNRLLRGTFRVGILVAVTALLTVGFGYRRPAGGRIAQSQLSALLPSVGLFDAEVIRRNFYDMHFKPAEQPDLAFHLLVPRTWIERDVEIATDQDQAEDSEPVPLAILGSKDHDDALLEVSYLRPTQGASLRRLMDEHAQRMGARILARQPGSFNNRQVEDALLRRTHPQLGPCLTRVTISRHGEYLFLVSGSARENTYPEVREIFGAAAVSFTVGGTAPPAENAAADPEQ